MRSLLLPLHLLLLQQQPLLLLCLSLLLRCILHGVK